MLATSQSPHSHRVWHENEKKHHSRSTDKVLRLVCGAYTILSRVTLSILYCYCSVMAEGQRLLAVNSTDSHVGTCTDVHSLGCIYLDEERSAVAVADEDRSTVFDAAILSDLCGRHLTLSSCSRRCPAERLF